MAGEPVTKKARTEEPGTLGEDVICFQVTDPSLGEADSSFAPMMTHQLLGEEEMVYGYRNPKVAVSLSIADYKAHVAFKHEGSLQGKRTEIERLISEGFAEAQQDTVNDAGSREKLRDDPEHLGEAIETHERVVSRHVKIYHTNLSRAHNMLKVIHGRAQLLLPYFIDGASSIDPEDDGWELFTAVKTIAGVCCIIGFCTVYRVYAYAESSRLRISQIFVLPPFQRQGIGRSLVEAVYSLADKEQLQDVIYEDPTEEVENLREKVELERGKNCTWLIQLSQSQSQSITQMNGHATEVPTSVALPFDQVKKAQKELRITRQQVQKAWEVLLAEQEVFQKEPAASILRGLIARRLLGKFSDTERQAVGKQIVNLENQWGESYCMHKVPKSAGLKGMPVALDEKQEKGQSKEEREQAWEEAIEARWIAIAQLAGFA